MSPLIVRARPKDLGGFCVRRLLPYATHRMVGPFIFFDHIGPAVFPAGHGMDVRPHPHIGLATVTYLFEGAIGHRDSLGTERTIEPGAINWMTAGAGIVHSERTPPAVRAAGSGLHGIQLWVALPDHLEDTAPSFSHHPKDTLSELRIGAARVRVLLGGLFGRNSPVQVHSELFYANIETTGVQAFTLPGPESALYVISGEVTVGRERLGPNEMAIGTSLDFTAAANTHAVVLGGQPIGHRFIEWNFVASSPERIARARENWIEGPGPTNPRFPTIPGDSREFIPWPTPPTKAPPSNP